MIAKEELVYRTENVNEIFMPYYRYYIELKESGLEMADGLKLYGVYYVPAVSASTLWISPYGTGALIDSGCFIISKSICNIKVVSLCKSQT